MPPKGRPPTTTEKRNAQGGTPGNGAVSHRRQTKPVVLGQRISTTNRPDPPAFLPPAGRELWDEVVETLIEYNAATLLDVPNLTLMCMHWALAMAAWEAMLAEGGYDQGSTGQIRTSPLLKDFTEQSTKFTRLSEQFGLTTLARTRLQLLDVTTRATEASVEQTLGRNPRRTNRQIEQ